MGIVKIAKSIHSLEQDYKVPINNLFERLAKIEATSSDQIQLGYTQKAKGAGIQLSRGFEMVADYVRLSHGLYPHKRQCIDLVCFVREILRTAAPYALQNGIAFTYKLPHEAIITITEIRPLAIILSHLLSNACRFKAPNDMINVDLHHRDNMVYILVWDQGLGIPETVQPHIFEPYYSYSHDGAPFAGNGLGLTLAKELARFLGGDLNYAPFKLRSLFVLTLPLRRRKRPRLSYPPVPKEMALIMSDTLLENKLP